MADAIQRLVAGGGLQTVFQPIIDGSSGTPLGYEALTRGPERGPFEPAAALIAAAASAGSSLALERACLEAALRSFRELRLEGRLFLNLRPQTLLEWRDLARWLAAGAAAHRTDTCGRR